MEGVKDRIKATFVSLIPDAQWDQLCKLEIDKFFQKGFKDIVTEVMQEICKEYLKELFAQPEYSVANIWIKSPNANNGHYGSKVSDHVDSMIKEKMPDMLTAMLTSVLSDAFGQFFNNVNSRLQQRY